MQSEIQSDITCCVCFKEEDIISNNINTLIDLDTSQLSKNTIVKSACNIHYICIQCLHTIVTDWCNHPINQHNSHVYCPYPFSDCLTPMGTKNIFSHQAILKILSKQEGEQYQYHADRFAFPGFTLVPCPCIDTIYLTRCNFPVLVENELILSTEVGELIIQCHQNPRCCNKFCYHCNREIMYYNDTCIKCKLTSENSNPNILNRYIIKYDNLNSTNENLSFTNESLSFTNESDYLYYNKDITIDIALNYIINLINNHDTICICPICKICLHKTEQCNAISHHNIERCYACGRVGSHINGISNSHWSSNGINGCFRFNNDTFVIKYIPEYKCNYICQNHQGDCVITEHQDGIDKLNNIRLRAIIYHCIKSLLPSIRFIVLDLLYDKYANIPTAYELLPYQQTFILLEYYKNTYLDYCEDTVYEHLNLMHPKTNCNFINKQYTISLNEYIDKWSISENDYYDYNDTSITLTPPNFIFTIDE